jgi:hypothetical protein
VTFVIAHATTLPTASIEFRIGRLHRYPGYVESVQVRSLGGNERELSFEAGTLREGPVDPETGLPSVECTYMARLQTRVTEGPATAAGHGRCLPWALLAIGAAGHGRCSPLQHELPQGSAVVAFAAGCSRGRRALFDVPLRDGSLRNCPQIQQRVCSTVLTAHLRAPLA